ncbi:MAG: DUF4105 domain-containing protein [Pseudohongiellaceae bacterium]
MQSIKRRRRGLLAVILLMGIVGCFGSTSTGALEALPEDSAIALPSDLGKLHFYLITVDVGNHVWDNFGHTALRMVDENNNTDTVFNWGLFDTSGGVVRFSFNFFKGIMNYRLGTFRPETEMNNYRQQERTVWQERINLNNSQKALLYRRLMWNLQPENIVYPYQYFFDNCTTRVRDYLNEAMGGKISNMTNQMTPNTFRGLVLHHYQSLAVIAISLDIMMNSRVDRTVSQWEEMFLPSSLRVRLMNLPSDVASESDRLMLLSDTEILMEFSPPAAQLNPYYLAGAILLAPVIFLYLMLRRIPMSYFATHSRIGFRIPRFSFRLLGVIGMLTAFASGIYGVLMLGGWFVSGHEDLYHNWNLLLFWPTDLLGLAIAGRWLIQARPWQMTHNTAPFINYYLLAKALTMLIYLAVAGLGLTMQSMVSLFAFLLPGLFLLTVLVWIAGFELARPRHMFF